MKWMCALCLVALPVLRASEANAQDAREAVLTAQRRFFEAYQACDAQASARLTVDGILYFHSTGWMQTSQDEFLKTLSGTCGFEVLRFDPSEVRVYGDTAVVYGDVRLKMKTAPAITSQLKALQVFVRSNGEWRLLANQSSEPVPMGGSLRIPTVSPK